MRNFFFLIVVMPAWVSKLLAAETAPPADLFPPGTMAAVVVHNLGQVDAKVAAVSQALGFPVPSPITTVTAATGVTDGLDRSGDLILSLCRSPDKSRSPALCLQVPVSDYDRFLTSLGGQPGTGISTIRVFDETLVVAKRRNWAVVMDHDSRQGLQSALAADARVTPLPVEWLPWLHELDMALILAPEVVNQISSPAEKSLERQQLDDDAIDDLFGELQVQNRDGPTTLANGLSATWEDLIVKLRALLAKQPILRGVVSETDFLALGVRATDAGDTIVQLRLYWRERSQLRRATSSTDASRACELFGAGPFITAGGGSLPVPLASLLVKHAIEQDLASVAESGSQQLRPENVARLHEAVEKIVKRVARFSVLEKPSTADDGVYSNNFLLLDTDDASAVRDEIAGAVKSWNWLMDHVEGDFRMQFAAEQTEIAGKKSTEFTADTFGDVSLPETKAAMEELFGPDGIYRFQLVPLDKRRVLMANATKQQTEQLLAELSSAGKRLSDWPDVVPARSLLAESRQLEFVFAPREFSQRLRREREAGLEHIVGGPLVRPFPDSPAVAIAAETTATGMSIQIAAPADVLRASVQYFLQRR